MANSAAQTHGEDGTREVDLESGVLQGRAPSITTTGGGTQHEANGGESKRWGWDILKKITLTATMATLCGGYAQHNREIRGAGFGLLSAYSAEKAAESWPNRKATATNVAAAFGTAVWAGGTGAGNGVASTVGPAINTVSYGATAAKEYSQGNPDWPRAGIDAIEMAMFAGAGMAPNPIVPIVRAMAFSATAAGFFWDGVKEDKGFLGHGAGAVIWAIGAGLQNDAWQAAGSGTVAISEFARLVYPYLAPRTQDSPPEAAPEHPLAALTARQEMTPTAVAVPAQVPGTAVAEAANRSLPSGPAAEPANAQYAAPHPIPGTASLFLPSPPAAASHAYDAAPTTRQRALSAPGGLRSTSERTAAPAALTRSQSAPDLRSSSARRR
ncbi:hypothetical protein [Streptomyces fumanus]|uniref:hypothetical protein n=1 Tax=Streptomyces fumanus TaxID=67302 RepID=UPI00340CA4EB